jgi:hypothetical protein
LIIGVGADACPDDAGAGALGMSNCAGTMKDFLHLVHVPVRPAAA